MSLFKKSKQQGGKDGWILGCCLVGNEVSTSMGLFGVWSLALARMLVQEEPFRV